MTARVPLPSQTTPDWPSGASRTTIPTMPMRKQPATPLRWLALGLTAALVTKSFAQEQEEPEAPLDRFEVELVVFAYRDVFGNGETLRLPPEPPEQPDPFAEMGSEPDDEPVAPEPEPEEDPPPIRVTRLTNDQLKMQDIRQRIDRVDAYDLLLHSGFGQEGVEEKWAEPISVRRLRAPAQLDGTISLHRGRFLHVILDLALNPDGGFSEPYRLSERRRLRSGEVHYFDHPALGVVLTVRPEPEPEPMDEPVDTTADLAPGAMP